jgi:hypothetical protein
MAMANPKRKPAPKVAAPSAVAALAIPETIAPQSLAAVPVPP